MVRKVSKASIKYLHSIAYYKTSLPKCLKFKHLLGCDTIVPSDPTAKN